jgi:hypothetical protein
MSPEPLNRLAGVLAASLFLISIPCNNNAGDSPDLEEVTIEEVTITIH